MLARLPKDVILKLSVATSIVLMILYNVVRNTNYQIYATSSTQIMYNHVPRCGSRTVSSVMRQLALKNDYQVLNLGAHEIMVPAKQREFVSWFKSVLPERIVVAKNTYLIDFTTYAIANPTYINVIRDPLERSMSYFYWQKQGGCGPGGCSKSESWKELSYDDCVRRQIDQCTHPDYRGYYKIIPYFCGQEALCKFPSPTSLLKAKYNVDRYFKVVGILEDLPGFFEVLEARIPEMFTGISKVFNETGYKYYLQYKTSEEKKPEIKTIEIMKTKLKYDYDFYYWIKAKFYSTLWSVRNGTDTE